MCTEHYGRTLGRTWPRIGLLFVAATPLAGSLWAVLFPRDFCTQAQGFGMQQASQRLLQPALPFG